MDIKKIDGYSHNGYPTDINTDTKHIFIQIKYGWAITRTLPAPFTSLLSCVIKRTSSMFYQVKQPAQPLSFFIRFTFAPERQKTHYTHTKSSLCNQHPLCRVTVLVNDVRRRPRQRRSSPSLPSSSRPPSEILFFYLFSHCICSFLSVKPSLSPVSAIWACSVSLIFFEPFPLFSILVHSFSPLMNSCLQERKYHALVSHPFGWWFQFWIHFGRWWKFIIYFGRDDFVWLQRVLRIKLKFEPEVWKIIEWRGAICLIVILNNCLRTLNDFGICFNDHFDSCLDLNSLKFGTSCYFS